MGGLGLEKAGIRSWGRIFRNLSYEELYEHETNPSLVGFETAHQTKSGALNVDTGRFTGRSPEDKVFVVEESSRYDIWWANPGNPASDNKPITSEAWDVLHKISTDQLSGKDLYVLDGFAGANPETRLSVRVVMEVAWQAHFCKNMFIRPTEEELETFTPDWTILNACKAHCPNYEHLGLNSEVFMASSIDKRMSLIGGSWYGGEMKKGIFTMMNYFLPLKGIGSLHCSANMGENGDMALFFGLSGTGKTTLSTDPKRRLIGDDEHGWDDDGIFNFEGGCYAKCVDLSEESEPDIYRAIKRDALLENVVVGPDGDVDFSDSSKTENTRVSYPIYHIDNIVPPPSKGPHPSCVIFLTCDAFGILPPVARLSLDQAMYQYLSGYTAKVAGTEIGIKEPRATFSACYGAAFLALHPTVYTEVLCARMEQNNTRAYLVNTGWTGGPYGVGSRMAIKETRAIVDAILDGSIEKAEFEKMAIFNIDIPKALPGINPKVLNPRNAWEDKAAYDAGVEKLANMFIDNFKVFKFTEQGRTLASAGPQLT